MQKDLANATENLSQGLNELYGNDKTKKLFDLVKRQAEEIEKRNLILSRMQETTAMQHQNVEKLLEQNKHLESLLVSLRQERVKLIEEIEALKKTPKTTRGRKPKQNASDDTKAA